MRSVSADLAAAIDAGVRDVDAVVAVDWDGDGFAQPALRDTFGRSVTSGWGSADTGQPWTRVFGPAADYAVSGGVGTIALSTVNSLRTITQPGPYLNVEALWDVTVPVVATGASIVTGLVARYDPATGGEGTHYSLRAEFGVAGVVQAKITKHVAGSETTLRFLTLPGVTYTAGSRWWCRARVSGSLLQIRVWADAGSGEPDYWSASATDTTIGTAGRVGFRHYAVGGNTNTLPVVLSHRIVRVSDLDDPAVVGIDNLSPHAGSYTLDRAIVGDLPEQASLRQGSAAAEAAVTLTTAPVLQPAGSIGVRASALNTNGATTQTLSGQQAPSEVVRGDLLLWVLSWTNPTGSGLPYWTQQDFHDGIGSSGPPFGGWPRRLADTTAGTALRTMVHCKPADDTDVAYIRRPTEPSYFWSWSSGALYASTVMSVGALLPQMPGVWRVEAVAQQATSGTSHSTPTVEVTSQGCLLVTVWAARVTSAVTWSAPAGDSQVRAGVGTHATVNVAQMTAVSAPTGPGSYSRTATTSGSVTAATATIIVLAPVQGTADQPPGWYFSPLNDRSAVGGKPLTGVRADLGVRFATASGPQTVPRITRGLARTITTPSGGSTVLGMLDRREQIRATVLPPTLAWSSTGADATWLVSHALLLSGVPASPPPPGLRLAYLDADSRAYLSDARLHYTMHGSLYPTCGLEWYKDSSTAKPPAGFSVSASGGVVTYETPSWVPGPFVLGAYAECVSRTTYTYVRDTGTVVYGKRVATDEQAMGRVTCWIRGDTTGVPPGSLFQFQLTGSYASGATDFDIFVGVSDSRRLFWIMSNTATATVITSAYGPTLPADGQWHFVGIGWDIQGDYGSATVYWRLDTTDSSSSISPGAAAADLIEDGHFDWFSLLPIAELTLYAARPSDPWPNDGFVPQAIVDRSGLDLRYVVDRSPREAWELITSIAQAEGAAVYVDEDGIVRYRTRARYLDAQSQQVQLTLTADRSIMAIRAEHTVDVAANVVSAAYAEPYTITDWTTRIDGPIRLPAKTSGYDLFVTLDDPALSLDTSVSAVASAPTSGSYLIGNTNADGSGLSVTVGVSCLVNRVMADGTVRLFLFNSNSLTVWITDLRLWGTVVRTRPQVTTSIADLASAARYGQQPLSLPASPWVQTPAAVSYRCGQVLAELRTPRPVITDLAVRGDPRLQLGDRVRLVDADGIGLDGEWWITGIREQLLGSGGYVMRVDARQALPVGVWSGSAWNEAMWGG